MFVALRTTIERFAIPPQPFEDLLSAFEQDQRVREYETFAELADYCRRSADPVGRIVLLLCGCYTESNARLVRLDLHRAAAGEFLARRGPRLTTSAVSTFRDETRAPVRLFGRRSGHRLTNDAFIAVMQFEVARARYYLLGGLPLVQVLPWRLQIDIELFARGGLSDLGPIRRDRISCVGDAAVISKGDFARLFVGSLGRTAWRPSVAAARVPRHRHGARRTARHNGLAGRPLPSRTME